MTYRSAIGVVLALLVAPSARAAEFWEFNGDGRLDPFVGVGIVVRLGPLDRGVRVGLQLEGAFEWAYVDDTGMVRPTPLLRVGAHLGWTHPRTYSEVTGQAGLAASAGSDGGYVHLVGAMAGGGVGLASDGFAGPVVAGRVVAPFSTVSVAADRWKGAWTVPRLVVGPEYNLYCCTVEY